MQPSFSFLSPAESKSAAQSINTPACLCKRLEYLSAPAHTQCVCWRPSKQGCSNARCTCKA
eukprot:scaffold5364_cov15-Tisochrysis_lutea.AAC.2